MDMVSPGRSYPAWRLAGCPHLTKCLAASACNAPLPDLTVRIPFWKRALDLTVLIFLSPAITMLMLLISALIKLTSAGPVLFRQERIGLCGRRFTCLKFRTMRLNADTAVHQKHLEELISSDRPMQKMDHLGDSRLIPLGALLRSSGLDELPQLFNVLRGEMSIVGPRPCLPYEFEQYRHWHKTRLQTLPGLTGLWQVSGKNKTTFTQMMQLDILYVRSQSWLLDFRIMLKTGSVLLSQMVEMSNRCAPHPPYERPKSQPAFAGREPQNTGKNKDQVTA